jgi:hypothetical protein
MRKSALLASALVLSSTAALAAPALEEMRGCVTVVKTHEGRKCTLLRTPDGNEHLLVGRRLPPAGGGAVVLVRGQRTFGGNCPLRIIVSSFEVRNWNFTRMLCPR